MTIAKLQRSNFGDFFSSTMLPLMEETFQFNLRTVPHVRDQIFKKVNNGRDIWQYSEVHDMPIVSSISEGADYLIEKPLQGYDKTFSVSKYGLGFSISEEAIEDGKFDFVSDAVAKLAKSAREKQEQSAMDIFNNGFTSETTPDSQYIFATGHTTPTGTITIANKPSTDADLSFSSLSLLLSNFKKAFRGDSGIYYNIMPKILLVPVELELYARQLVGSSLKADSADNNINPFHLQLQVIASPHLSDSDAWFLVADKGENGARLVERKPIETKAGGMDIGFLNDAMFYKCRYREVLGAVNPFGLYGTKGA